MWKFNTEKIINMFKKDVRLILISILSMTLLSTIVTFFLISPKYEANTKVFIGKEKFRNVTNDYSSDEITMYQRLIKTYAEVAKAKDLMYKAINNAGIDIGVKEALSKVQAIPAADTQILELKYTSASREESYNMVYGLTEEFMKVSKTLYPDGNVQIIQQPIIPDIPVGPNNKINIALGVIFGMILGIGVIFLKEYMNNSFESKEELEEILGISCLGVIPEMEKID